MLLRWLLNTYLKQAAQEKILEAVSEAARSGLAETRTGEQEGEPPPPCEIVFLFALGIESGGLVDLLEDPVSMRTPHFVEHAGYLRGRRVAVIEGGAGRESAAQAAAAAIVLHQPAWVVSAGFAGALVDELKRGHFLLADSVGDSEGKTLAIGLRAAAERESPTWRVGRLLTVEKLVRKEAERRRLAEEHGALACDMETFAVAEVCAGAKSRLISARIITDAVQDELPRAIEQLLSRKSLAAKLGAATGALLNRPASALDLWKLREDALLASDRLARFLSGVAEQLPSAAATD